MSTVTLRPNSTDAGAATVTGAATAHAAASDNSDASYYNKSYYAPETLLGMTTSTKPAGSVMKQIRAGIRWAKPTLGTSKIDLWVEYFGTEYARTQLTTSSGTTWVVSYTPWVSVGDGTQAFIDALQIGTYVPLSPHAARVAEVYLEIVFALAPTVVASGTVSGTSTTVFWTHTPGEDGGPQTRYRAYLLNASGQIVHDTGWVVGTATSSTKGGLPSGNYTWWVQTAQEAIAGYIQYSNYDDAAITIPVQTRAEVTTLATTPNPSTGAIALTANRDTAQDAWTDIDVESIYGINNLADIGNMEAALSGVAIGWAMRQSGTVSGTSESLQTSGAESGSYQRFTATLGAGASRDIFASKAFAVTPGDIVVVRARVKTTRTGTAGPVLYVSYKGHAPGPATDWYSDLPGTLDVYQRYNLIYVPVSASWATAVLVGVAPPGARSYMVAMEAEGSASGGTITIDLDLVSSIRSSVDWTGIRTDLALATNTATGNDYDVPAGQTVFYRARAVNAGGAVGSWVYSDAVIWDATSFMFLPPTEPAAMFLPKLAAPPSRRQDSPGEILTILGSRLPVARHDVQQSNSGEFLIQTANKAEADALEAAVRHGVVMVNAPSSYRFPSGFYRLGTLQEIHQARPIAMSLRRWSVPFVEVAKP